MQIFIHCKTTLHVSGVTAPIIRSMKNYPQPPVQVWQYDLYRRLRVQYLILVMMGAVTPETYRVVLRWINICILLHMLDFLPVILVRISWNLNFLNRFSKNRQISNFTQNPSNGSRVVPCGRTDTTKLQVAFFGILRTRQKNLFYITKPHTMKFNKQFWLLTVHNFSQRQSLWRLAAAASRHGLHRRSVRFGTQAGSFIT